MVGHVAWSFCAEIEMFPRNGHGMIAFTLPHSVTEEAWCFVNHIQISGGNWESLKKKQRTRDIIETCYLPIKKYK